MPSGKLRNPVPRVCKREGCGVVYTPNTGHQKYCGTLTCDRARKAAYMRHLWATEPERMRQKANEYYYNNPEVMARARDKYLSVPCILCGEIKRNGKITNAKKATFVCGECKTRINRTIKKDGLLTRCTYCGHETTLEPGRGKRALDCAACKDRRITLEDVGRKVGVSRERIRQVIASRFQYLPLRELQLMATLKFYGYESLDSERDPTWSPSYPPKVKKTWRDYYKPTGRPVGRPRKV